MLQLSMSMLRNNKIPKGTGGHPPFSLWKCVDAVLTDLPTFSISNDNCHQYQILEDTPEFTTSELSTIFSYYNLFRADFKVGYKTISITWVDYQHGVIKFRKFSRLN